MIRLYEATGTSDLEQFQYWSHRLYASRETSELREEEKQRARALYAVLDNLPDSSNWHELESCRQSLLQCQLAGYAVAANHWQITLPDLLQGYTWSWMENAVAAAIKLVPLGQTEGQRLLYELSTEISEVIEHAATLDESAIGASAPAQAIASSLHETQYSRLFRS